MRRGLFLCIPFAGLLALLPAAASADAGATLTVPGQVQAAQNTTAAVQPSFSYPEATPFCTVGVDFTWDGAAWLSEFPIKNGDLCVAGGVNANAPDGHAGAGSHQVCGSAGPRFSQCKTISIVVTAAGGPAASGQPTAAPARPAGAGSATAAPEQAPATATQTPATGPIARTNVVGAAVDDLSPQQRIVGAALLAVGVVGLLAIVGRRLILSRRPKATPLPSPERRR